MENNAYETRVREIAEEMARENFDCPLENDTKFVELEKEERDFFTGMHMKAARMAVKHMAEAYKAGYSIGRDMVNDPYSRAGLKTMLLDSGLIPSPDQTTQQ